MLIRVSQLIAFSLLFLVGCSSNSPSSSDLPTNSNASSSPSFLGCWQGGPPANGGTLVIATYVFESNNAYSAKQEIRSQYVNKDSTWTGTWENEGDYILAVSDDSDVGKVTFKILSDYEIHQVGQNFNYSRC